MIRLLKIVEEEHFQYELTSLLSIKKKNVTKDNKLIKLAHFLYKDGLMGAGGRLNNSNSTADEEYPVICCKAGESAMYTFF